MKALWLYSSLPISVYATGFTLATYMSGDRWARGGYLLLILLATYVVYTLDRVNARQSPEDRLNRPGQADWQKRNQRWLKVGLLPATLGAGWCLYKEETTLQLMVLGFGLLAVGYMFILPGLLRRLAGGWGGLPGLIKPAMVALIWTGGTVLVPLYADGGLGDIDYYIILERYIYLTANAMAFDILDYAGDRKYRKLTLAVRSGRKRALQIVGIFLVSGIILNLLMGLLQVRTDFLIHNVQFLTFLALVLGFKQLYRRLGRRNLAQLIDMQLLLPLLLSIIQLTLNDHR